MNITLHVGPVHYDCTLPFAGAKSVDVAGTACTCGNASVRCDSRRIVSHDTYAGDAYCSKCQAPAGELRVRCETMFGLEEDHAVLNGRARVYA